MACWRFSPVRAGLYSTAFLRNGMTSRQAEESAAAHGLETMGLHRLTLARPDPRGLVLGFAAFDETSHPQWRHHSRKSAGATRARAQTTCDRLTAGICEARACVYPSSGFLGAMRVSVRNRVGGGGTRITSAACAFPINLTVFNCRITRLRQRIGSSEELSTSLAFGGGIEFLKI